MLGLEAWLGIVRGVNRSVCVMDFLFLFLFCEVYVTVD